MINAKEIVQKLKGESTRSNKTYYLLQSLVQEFEKACQQDKVVPSKVIEELMRKYLESREAEASKPIKKSVKKN